MTRVKVRLTPRGRRHAIDGWAGDLLPVRLAAAPVDRQANDAPLRLLAKAPGVPPERPYIETMEAAVQAAVASVASSRSARVQEIVAAVRSGQYYPSPQQIAQRLVSEAEIDARIRAMMTS